MIWFADFETKQIDKQEIRVCLGYIEELDTDNSKLFLNIGEMFEFVKSQKTRSTHIIYFHNLSFDGEYIIWWLLENGFVPVKDDIKKTGQFKERCDFYGAKSEIYINYKSTKIKILCSYKLWPVKLKEIGSSLNFEKLECDFDKIDFYEHIEQVPNDVKNYIIRDVQILKKKYDQYSKVYPIKKTASSSSWKVFKNWYENHFGKQDFKYNYSIDESWHKYLSRAYWGGFTQINSKFLGKHIKQKINHYDINSSYPSIFTEELLPYGNPQLTKPEGDYVEIIEAVISKIKKKDKNMIDHLHNWIKCNKFQEHYINEYEDCISVMYIRDEWEEIKKSYDFEIIKKEHIYFKATNKLGQYINEMFHLKENETDPVVKNDHKQILNTFTGKWGQSIYQAVRYLRKKEPNDDKKYEYNGYVYETIFEKTKEIKYIPIAIFVTALARVKLIKTIRKNIDKFLYCDTDSIILLDSFYQYDNIKIDKNKLGFWKLEQKASEIKIIKPKTYILKNENGDLHKVLAGINKECHHLYNFENLYVGSEIKNGNLKKVKLKGGFVLKNEDVIL